MVTVAAMHAATAYLCVPGQEGLASRTLGRLVAARAPRSFGVTSDSDRGRKEASPIPLVRTLTCTANTHLASGLAS